MQESDETEQDTGPKVDAHGIYERDGKLYRNKVIPAPDGTKHIQVRPVARTLEEAKAKRWDFWFSEERGWYINGFKWESDTPTEVIMADGSAGRPRSIESQEQSKEEAMNG